MPGQDHDTKVGNETAGYRVVYTTGSNDLNIEGWGYWDKTISATFPRDTMKALRKVAAPVRLMLELSGLKPQGSDGQEALRIVLRYLANVTLSGGTVHVDSPLTKMQLVRLLREHGLDKKVNFAGGASARS